MGDSISDLELRRRLLAFNPVVPPITGSTRKLLLKKLANLESGATSENATSKIMPPPKSKAPSNGTNESIIISSSAEGSKPSQHITFNRTDSPRKSARRNRRPLDSYDTSDSEVDAGSLERSILPANPYITSSSPKSNETSLMNVSNKTTFTAETNDNDLAYSSSPEKNKTPNRQLKIPTQEVKKREQSDPVVRKHRLNHTTKVLSNAEIAIQRWKEKKMNQSQNENNVLNNSLSNLSSSDPKVSSRNLRKNNLLSAQQKYRRNYNTKYIINNILLVGVFVAVVFGLYFISTPPNITLLPPGILKSLCTKKNLQGSKCDTEQYKVQHIYNGLIAQVQDKYIKKQCDNSSIEPTVDAQTLFEYISTHENIPSREIEELVELFKSIAKTYSDSPVGFDTSFNINVPPNLPIMCAAKNMFSNMFYVVMWIGIVTLSVVGLYFVLCYISTKSEIHKQEVIKLIESTIKLLKTQAVNQPDESYLPIIHIRDTLIPFDERQAKSKIWAEVVQYFTECESSVRSEVQEIDGEDFQVWRWVSPMSPSI